MSSLLLNSNDPNLVDGCLMVSKPFIISSGDVVNNVFTEAIELKTDSIVVFVAKKQSDNEIAIIPVKYDKVTDKPFTLIPMFCNTKEEKELVKSIDGKLFSMVGETLITVEKEDYIKLMEL